MLIKINKYLKNIFVSWKSYFIIKSLNQFSAKIETQNKQRGTIQYKDITWTKKEFDEILKIGDIVYVKKIENDIMEKIGLKTQISNRKNNKGSVTFDYRDLDQLNRLIEIIKKFY